MHPVASGDTEIFQRGSKRGAFMSHIKPTVGEETARTRSPGRFSFSLTIVAVAALSLRIIVILLSRDEGVGGDGFGYFVQANWNDTGRWFVVFNGRPEAHHPPAWVLLLTAWVWTGQHSVFSQQVLACVVGTATVVVVGLAGRRLGGDRVGLIAAGIAAVYAGFWVYERALLSETLLLLVVAVMIFLAYGYLGRPSVGRAAALGATCGLLVMTRSEQVLVLPLLLVPLILTTKNVDWRARIGWLAIAVASMIVVVAPWTIYNLGRFERPVILSTGFGTAALTGSCSTTFSGADIGYNSLGCLLTVSHPSKDESIFDIQEEHVALSYTQNHLSRVPLVVFAREGRAFGYWNPFQQTMLDNAFQKVPPVFKTAPTTVWVYDLRLITYWILLVPAIAGGVILRRRRVPLYPLLAFIVTVVLTVAVTYGETRYRAAAEVPIALLAAVGIDAFIPRKSSASFSHKGSGVATLAPSTTRSAL
jgi:4-amino-4-deoxy-L-arabinose transferase-like glycosyltransferase